MADEAAIAVAILEKVRARGPGRTVCPSEVARALESEEDAWRALMPAVRRVAGVLVREGRIVVTRRGEPVDPEAGGGPIRLGLPEERPGG